MQKPFAVPAETMPVPAETIYHPCRNHSVPAEATVPLHKPKNVPTVLGCGKIKNSVYAGANYKIV